ncbi:MAG: phosphonopyruvate decarboxylase [Candidatus Cloacimonadota bacterium]|nr:MAG: phosphonopyruvate decarboxylase [Candidatus Cloacimonadota bacterium]
MLDQESFFNKLTENGIFFFTGVPDSLLNDFCKYLIKNIDKENHVLAANEGNAVGIAAGYYLSTKKVPLVYMQNSGLGNTLNPLLSLADKCVYSIPMVLLIGWRGDPDIVDHPQHELQGIVTPKLLDISNIPYKTLDDDKCDYNSVIKWAYETAVSNSMPAAILVKKNVLSKNKGVEVYEGNETYSLSRSEAIEIVLNSFPKDTIFVASTGRITRELYWLRESRKETHKNDFLNVGAMGHTSSIALGLAIKNPNRKVVCLDGDAATLMHMGCLPINGCQDLNNFVHIVLNNGSHESVGGQDSVGFDISINNIAKESGYNISPKYVTTKEEIEDAIVKNRDRYPLFMEVRVKKGISGSLPPLDFDLKVAVSEFLENNLMRK